MFFDFYLFGALLTFFGGALSFYFYGVYSNLFSPEQKLVPSFLINKSEIVNENDTLVNGLKLIDGYLNKTILRPNNLNYPYSRIHFMNSLR